MNIKKILILLIFAIAIVGIITPVSAELYPNLIIDSLKEDNGKTKLYLYGHSDTKKELNNVNKITVSIKGYQTITFKKPAKGWKQQKVPDGAYFEKYFKIKGNPKKLDNKKDYILKFYNKKGKLLKTEKGKLYHPERQ